MTIDVIILPDEFRELVAGRSLRRSIGGHIVELRLDPGMSAKQMLQAVTDAMGSDPITFEQGDGNE